MDCFPCSVAKRRVELEMVARGAPHEQTIKVVAATRCAMCAEFERQEAKRQARQSAQA
jgi:hypothetical protein